MAVKKPIPTNPVPNPLHNYASYTYTWSLWWLDVSDYNALTKKSEAGSAITYPLGPNSYVVAEDAGLYPNRRLPSTYGLNYHIQDVQFTTVIGLNKNTKSTNMIEGSMTIIEPYGVTLIDALLEASFDGSEYKNYLQQPFMLELNFTGYDDGGEPITDKYANIFRKRFPIKIIECKLSVTGKGTEYKIKFVPTGHGEAFSEEMRTTPKAMSIVAGTVQEFFAEVSKELSTFWKTEVTDGKRDVADIIKFEIDPVIATGANGKITLEKETPITVANPKAKNNQGIELTKNSFNIPKGTPYIELINKVIAQSEWLINLQLGLEKQEKKKGDQTSVFNAFKTVTSCEYLDFDKTRNSRGKIITYKVLQYPTWNSNHPNLPQLADSTPYTTKKYDYLYTGKNLDILDLKLQFDTTFYTAVNNYTKNKAATEATAKTGETTLLSKLPSFLPSLSFLSKFIPQLGGIPTVTPVRYHSVAGDQSNTIGLNLINRPGAQQASDVLKSVYSNAAGDMVNVQLTIVGDPTLIKQDDWLYTPSARSSSGGGYSAVSDTTSIAGEISGAVTDAVTGLITGAVSSVFGGITGSGSYHNLSQYNFARQYGHIKMDGGEVVCSLTVNTPVDIDADITNQGLVYPQPGTRQSFFSGQYKIVTVDNRFSGGQFTQTLTMIRYNNSDQAKAFGSIASTTDRISLDEGAYGGDAEAQEGGFYGDNSVGTSQQNQTEFVPTNSSTAAGDEFGATEATLGTPGVVTYDDGSSIQTFDDGSTLITDSEGRVTATESADSGTLARSDNSIRDWRD